MLVIWGRKTHIEDLLIAWQTHCTMQVATVCPRSCFWLINCDFLQWDSGSHVSFFWFVMWSFNTHILIVKSAICFSAVKASYCFDILRNEMNINRQVKRTRRPLVGPSLSKCTWTLLTFVLEFEVCTMRAFTGPAPVQVLKKTGSRMPLRLKKAVLVRSNYIPHTFNPYGDVTMSYLLWTTRLYN